jgi:hypothetical protein
MNSPISKKKANSATMAMLVAEAVLDRAFSKEGYYNSFCYRRDVKSCPG